MSWPGRDVDWYLQDTCFYEVPEAPRVFFPGANRYLEIWSYPDGHPSIFEEDVSPQQISAWLYRNAPYAAGNQEPLGGLRLIISTIDTSHSRPSAFNFNKTDLTSLVTAFNLPLQYLEGHFLKFGCYNLYHGQQLGGIASPSHTGFIISPPDRHREGIDATFTYDAWSNITCGIVRVSNEEALNDFTELVKKTTNPILPIHFVILEMLVHSITMFFGHDDFRDTLDVPQPHGSGGRIRGDQHITEVPLNSHIDFEKLTLDLGRMNQRMADRILTAKSVRSLCDFTLKSINHIESLKLESATSSTSVDLRNMRLQVDTFISKLEHLLAGLDNGTGRCGIRHQRILSLQAQRSTQQALDLAESSKILAARSERDGSAMKTIALLGMIFLPGACISALFALPFFDWGAESWDTVIKSRFWVYWAVTIPITMILLAVWQRHDRRRGNVLKKSVEVTLHDCREPRQNVVFNDDGPNHAISTALANTATQSSGRDISSSVRSRLSTNTTRPTTSSLEISPSTSPQTPDIVQRSEPSTSIPDSIRATRPTSVLEADTQPLSRFVRFVSHAILRRSEEQRAEPDVEAFA